MVEPITVWKVNEATCVLEDIVLVNPMLFKSIIDAVILSAPQNSYSIDSIDSPIQIV